MPTDIETQVRDYTEFFVTALEPVTQEDIIRRPVGSGAGRVRTIDPEPRPGSRRGWLVSVAVAAATLVVVGIGALLARAPNPESLVVTTPATASMPELSWTRASPEVLDAEGRVDVVSGAVLTDRTRLVGVGWTEIPDSGAPLASQSPMATVWTSATGAPWAPVLHPDDGLGSGLIEGIVAAGPGFVAAGTDTGMRDAAVWISPNGISWNRVPDDDVFERAAIFGLTVGGPGLVAVGLEGSPQAVQEATPAVWSSRDGIVWSRIPHDPEIFRQQERMTAAYTTPDGLLAVGRRYNAPVGMSSVQMWASADGVEWRRVTVGDGVFGEQAFASMTQFADGLLAVGSFGGSAAVWTSTDGNAWTRTDAEPDSPGEGVETWMNDVVVTEHGLVAVGGMQIAPGGRQAAMWTSSDGMTWSRIPFEETVFGGQPEVEMVEIILGDDRLYILGESGSGELLAQTIWTATFED